MIYVSLLHTVLSYKFIDRHCITLSDTLSVMCELHLSDGEHSLWSWSKERTGEQSGHRLVVPAGWHNA